MANQYFAMLGKKDPASVEHSKRVAELAERFVSFLPFSDEEKQHVVDCAQNHDLGKLKVPLEILDKPGPLSKDEWEIMKKHPIWSGEYMQAEGAHVLDVRAVQAHHERLDGNGYPMGLDAGSIPMAARIIAICDSVDAMLSKRCYKAKPLNNEQCKEELLNGSGKQFDPLLVSVFLGHWENIVLG